MPRSCRRHATRVLAVVVAFSGLVWSSLVWGGLVCGEEPRPEARSDLAVARLLEDRCLSCHDALDHKGELSLETRESLLSSGLVDPASAESSRLVEVLRGEGDQPPAMPKEGRPLTDEQVRLVTDWIRRGAPYPDGRPLGQPRQADYNWWSLKPLRRPDVPRAATSAGAEPAEPWGHNPIDAFVLAGLAEQRLEPAPEADRATLIRRLSYDLLGLPPSHEEVEAFVADPDPLAYERLVDRLLASPRHGERWARHWLDVAQYADTHGYDKDKLREHAWPYRDYVIDAFNGDKPYRRFIREQLAGDVLWPDDPAAITATGFLAAGPWDFIGHAEVPESKLDGQVARNLDRDNMVTSTLNAFCSLTVQCARCHHHKLDPVTMQDYYRLQAVFAAIDRADRPYEPEPAVALRRAELARELALAQERLAAAQAELDSLRTPELVAVEERLAKLRAEPQPTDERSAAYGYHSQVAATPDQVKWVQVDLGESRPIDDVLLFGADEYGWSDFGFPERLRVELGGDAELADRVVLADLEFGEQARPGAAPVRIAGAGRVGRYVRVTATRLWSRRRAGEATTNDWIFALGELAVVSRGELAPIAAVSSLDSIEAPPRWSRVAMRDGVYGRAALAAAEGPASVAEQLLLRAESAKERDALRDERERLLIAAAGPERLQRLRALEQELTERRQQLESLPAPMLVYAGTVHAGSGAFRGRAGLGPRPIHVLHRGDVSHPQELVGPGTVPLGPALAGGEFSLRAEAPEGERRAALAEWVVRDEHPLTWRSIANRLWQYHLGRGFVDTPNDFGRGGELPSHPDLLDWLAVELRDNNGSLKHLHRLICTSATYRQASRSTPERTAAGVAADAENRLLWRMNRRKLTAEELRDTTLLAADRLDLRMGGPGFQDFVIEQPAHSPHYEYDLFDPTDPRSHRRTIYRFIVRSQPQPFLTTLDCADASASVPRRDETLTPLQALALLNNRFMLTMSRRMAERLARDNSDVEQQIDEAFQLLLDRAPLPDERSTWSDYTRRHGLANTCRWLLNLNELVFVE